jgi:hypothetical protein
VPGRSKKQVPQVSHIRRLTSGGEAVCKCMDRSAVAAILIRHRAAKKVVAKSAVGHRRGPVHLLLLAERSPPARTEPLAERLLTAQHVGVAPSIVNNNPETTERGRRSFPAAAGWFSHVASFGRNAPGTAALMLRSIAARASTDASTDSGRRDASRSMRAIPWLSSSFETRARAFDSAEALAHARSSG